MTARPLPDRSSPPNLSSYDEARASFHIEVPDRFNPVVDIVERWAAEAPDDLALLSLGPDGATVAEHTAAALAAEAQAVARALLAQGLRPGDPALLKSRTRPGKVRLRSLK